MRNFALTRHISVYTNSSFNTLKNNMKRNLLLSICVVACGLTASSHAQVKNNTAYGKIRTKAADETLTKAPEGGPKCRPYPSFCGW